jgi:adenosylcobinamide-GDP ribazoletransferase
VKVLTRRILLALQFLTIIPLRETGRVSEKEMGQTTAVFPVVGIFEGIILAVLCVSLLQIFTPETTAALIVTVLTLMNGVLHMDGLADTFDAIASRGDKDKRLSIMKDSTIGVAGVVAIVLDILLRYVFIREVLLFTEVGVRCSILFLSPVIARWSMVVFAFYSVAVKKEGLGQIFTSHTGTREVIVASLIAILSLYGAYIFTHQVQPLILYFALILPVMYVFSFLSAWFFKRVIGGVTGDSFGAMYEVGTILVLLMSVIWM